MRYITIVLATLALASVCQASAPGKRIMYYVHQVGGDPASVDFGKNVGLADRGEGVKITKWKVPGVPRPYDMGSIVDGEAVDAWYSDYAAAKVQSSKPIEQKVGENKFFALITAVLTEAGDARKDQVPPPKLTFTEIDELLDVMYAAGVKDKVVTRLSIKLLSVDAYLKRFSAAWWDDAEYHTGL